MGDGGRDLIPRGLTRELARVVKLVFPLPGKSRGGVRRRVHVDEANSPEAGELTWKMKKYSHNSRWLRRTMVGEVNFTIGYHHVYFSPL